MGLWQGRQAVGRRRERLRLFMVAGITAAVVLVGGANAIAAPGLPVKHQSANFVVHTDLAEEDAQQLLDQLETMLRIISRYWGVPLRQPIECYVVDDPANWSSTSLPAQARASVRNGGITIADGVQLGNRIQLRATVYASSKFGTPLHEAVHAYCYHAFGQTGPTWYAEGMAEMGNYWVDGDVSVTAPEYVIQFLKNSPRKSIEEIIDDRWGTGDGWQNYAWRWALCHFLANNPNYSDRFRVLGVSLLAGQPASFQRLFSSRQEELEFEFQFFIDHLERGLRADRCVWDWQSRARPLTPTRKVSAKVHADLGWQPARVRVTAGQSYRCVAKGDWATADGKDVAADGDETGAGRLVAVVFDDYKLSQPVELGADVTFIAPSDGLLLLRCRDEWNRLDDNSGIVTVELQLAAQQPPPLPDPE